MSRLRWLCRRGMKELDVVLTRYLDTRYAAAPPAERACFSRLLDMTDPELFGLLLGREAAGDPELEAFVQGLRDPGRNRKTMTGKSTWDKST